MASSCPKCGQVIEAEFGVLNCPSCAAMLSVDFDGSVHLAEEESSAEAVNAGSDDLDSDMSAPKESSWPQQQQQQQEQNFDANEPAAVEPPLESENGEDFFKEDTFSNPEADSSNTEAEKVEGFQQENSDNIFEKDEEDRTRVLESSGYQDVEDFGNSELSSSTSGGIVYDLMIEGIDTKEMRDEIRLELKDRRYRLDSDALLKSIHNGKLVIKGLNPAKTALLVNHLKHLDVEIQWKQNEIIRM